MEIQMMVEKEGSIPPSSTFSSLKVLRKMLQEGLGISQLTVMLGRDLRPEWLTEGPGPLIPDLEVILGGREASQEEESNWRVMCS